MREIKFRSWAKHVKAMNYDPVIFGSHEIGECWINSSIKNQQEDGYIFMQFTGLKDRNGKEIYEGDVVEFDNTLMQVVWHEYGFKFWQKGWSEIHALNQEAKLIGNVHENPELLK